MLYFNPINTQSIAHIKYNDRQYLFRAYSNTFFRLATSTQTHIINLQNIYMYIKIPKFLEWLYCTINALAIKNLGNPNLPNFAKHINKIACGKGCQFVISEFKNIWRKIGVLNTCIEM